jgi:hypothetical protein
LTRPARPFFLSLAIQSVFNLRRFNYAETH